MKGKKPWSLKITPPRFLPPQLLNIYIYCRGVSPVFAVVDWFSFRLFQTSTGSGGSAGWRWGEGGRGSAALGILGPAVVLLLSDCCGVAAQ